ncbi:PTS sugar transporter subunit IIA [bacterium]|nr:MAG: PTS sugar transporter subunit IIA [bacterium]
MLPRLTTTTEDILLKPGPKSKLSEILLPSTIYLDLKGLTKQEIIDELITILDRAGFLLDRAAVREAVIERESKLSTGLGAGVAVPHGKTSGVNRLVAAFGIKREGIHFDAADGQPVKLFFMLVSPPSVSGPHVKALAQIAKFLRTDKNKEKLLNAKTSEEIHKIFASE